MGVEQIIPSYAAAGVAVLPLHSVQDGRCSCGRDCPTPAKHPRTRNGKDDATTDLGTVAEWMARWPGCNWGVRPPKGVVVLDVDPRNGGDVALAELEMRHGRLPATLTAVTGSGGLHIWLTYNGPARGKLCAGVDVKTNTGYLVAPPSRHISGGTYYWRDQRPAEYAPRWVTTILNPPVKRTYVSPTGNGSIDALVRYVANSGEGDRNRHLFWAACRAFESGHEPTPIADAAVTAGLTTAEVTATIRSAARTVRGVREQVA